MKNIYTILFIFVFSSYFSSAQVNQLWGMTSAGGGTDSAGTIFKIGMDGKNFGIIHSFQDSSGSAPNGSLIFALNGLYYGMTQDGGYYGAGVIFDYDPSSNTYSDVFDFDYYNNGGYPANNFIMGNDGTLYGMTSDGGANAGGTIFSFNPAGNFFTHLYDFTDQGGRNPYGSLLQAANGKLYGLTSQGGVDSAGTLFSFDLSDSAYSDLHDFSNSSGDVPNGSLITAKDTLLYGMTSAGGANGSGVIFSFSIADSVYNDVYDFNNSTGENPFGSLIQANDGLLYGMTSAGGANGLGVIFNFYTSFNNYADLFDFAGPNGSSPEGELLQASDNNLYGMTLRGGANDDGMVFSFDQTNSNYVDLLDFDIANGQYPWSDLIEVIPTGISEVKNETENIQLYPNPAKNELIINPAGAGVESGIIEIDVYDVLGEEVYNQQPENQNSKSETVINVSGLSAGVYFVEVQYSKSNLSGAGQEQNKWVGKFVKE